MIGRSVQIEMTRLITGGRISKLLHGLFNREAAGLLARRELLEAYEMLRHQRLRRDEHEGMLDKPSHIVARLMLGPLERVGAQVEQRRQTQLHHRLRPDIEAVRLLLEEHRLPLLVA